MSHSMLVYYVFLFFFSFSSSTISSYLNTSLTTHTCSAQQSQTLLLFKQSLSSINFNFDVSFDDSGYTPCKDWLGSGGYYPTLMNWDTSTDCCDWNGVTCDYSTGDIIGLDLSCGMLRGTIHHNTSLFNLPYLQRLNLAYNNFSGSQIPREIGRFSKSLTHLNISHSEFHGQVPTNIRFFHNLVSLDLSENDFSLEPHVFVKLLQNSTSLKELSLVNVNISSSLPNYLNISSSSLKLFNLEDTGLQGKIPDDIFNSQSLEILDLSSNSFTGQIPSKISLLPKLVSFSLYENIQDNLRIQRHVFNGLLNNSTLLRDLQISNVDISWVLPTDVINISSSLNSLELINCNLMGSLPKSPLNLTRLTDLDLSSNKLNGTLPSWLFTLPSLEYLFLDNNMFSGDVPFNSFALPSLKELYLSNCNLMGSLPKSPLNLTRLTYLDLRNNKLNGTLPSWLFTLPSLEYLVLSNNTFSEFSGDVPFNSFALSSLKTLDLSDCNLMGSLPKSPLNLTSLTYLNLGNNKLNGTLPSWLFTLPSLEDLELYNNMFSGHIDQALILKFTNLTRLDLSYNNFSSDWELDTLLSSLRNLRILFLSYSGLSITTSNATHHVNPNIRYLRLASCKIKVFPESIRSMSILRQLDLSYNFITGLPAFQLYGLEYLGLQSNQIQGPFPPSICNLGNLFSLDLSNNSFGGVIPQCFGNFSSSLSILNLNSNQLQGLLPRSICNLRNLNSLDLSKNSFGGVIPKCFRNFSSSLVLMDLGINDFHGTIPEMSDDCGGLQGLILNGNRLQGELPTSLFSCHSLRVLDLGNNHLNGTFPNWLGGLPQLQVLNLKSNNFHGPIVTSSLIEFPFPRLRVLDLSHNRFVGQLPRKYFENFNSMIGSVKRSTKLEYLNVGNSYYSVVMTVKGQELPFAKISVDYMIVDLSNNGFEGEIPNIICKLTSLIVLNLSRNSLMGQIPHAIGNLKEIESLDLSCNRLTGEIPPSLVDITNLEYLNLSENNLAGHIPEGRQFSTFESSFQGNPKLCGFPLPNKCSEHPHEPHIEDDGEDEGENAFTWRVVMMGYGCGTFVGLLMGYLMLSTGRPKWFNAIADAGEHLIHTRRPNIRYIYIGK